jgi:hypothetical protein
MKYADRPETWKEAERARCRAKGWRYRTSPAAHRRAVLSYERRYPEKIRAKKRNKQTAPPGMVCHHWNYAPGFESDVLFMGKRQHATAHRFLRYDKEAMIYRTMDGVLLDTKKAHEKYIKQWTN